MSTMSDGPKCLWLLGVWLLTAMSCVAQGGSTDRDAPGDAGAPSVGHERVLYEGRVTLRSENDRVVVRERRDLLGEGFLFPIEVSPNGPVTWRETLTVHFEQDPGPLLFVAYNPGEVMVPLRHVTQPVEGGGLLAVVEITHHSIIEALSFATGLVCIYDGWQHGRSFNTAQSPSDSLAHCVASCNITRCGSPGGPNTAYLLGLAKELCDFIGESCRNDRDPHWACPGALTILGGSGRDRQCVDFGKNDLFSNDCGISCGLTSRGTCEDCCRTEGVARGCVAACVPGRFGCEQTGDVLRSRHCTESPPLRGRWGEWMTCAPGLGCTEFDGCIQIECGGSGLPCCPGLDRTYLDCSDGLTCDVATRTCRPNAMTGDAGPTVDVVRDAAVDASTPDRCAGVTCPTCQTCRVGRCVSVADLTTCGTGRECVAGTCVAACAPNPCQASGLGAGTICDGRSLVTCTTSGRCRVEAARRTCPTSCAAGRCDACPSGTADCDGNAANGCEVNVTTSPTHCGRCNNVCTGTQRCSAGACGPNCSAGLQPCGARCVNLTIDPANCGGCGVVCPTRTNASATCAGGRCGIDCATGFGDCDGNPANGCERDLRGDVGNCGACGVRCSAPLGGTATCGSGVCRSTCGSPSVDCGGRCVNPATDASHCGACDRACGSLQYCDTGVCRTACATPTTLCGTRCVDLRTDPSNCGACRRVCAASERCNAGVCQLQCSTGLTPCSGSCVDLRSSRTHCGACGRTCTAAERCESGRCVLNCNPGEVICSGICADLNSHSSHCGACGHACGSGQRCESGRCQPVVCGSSRPTLVRPVGATSFRIGDPVEFEWIAPAACINFTLRGRYCCNSGDCTYPTGDNDLRCAVAFERFGLATGYLRFVPAVTTPGYVRWTITTANGVSSDLGVMRFR